MVDRTLGIVIQAVNIVARLFVGIVFSNLKTAEPKEIKLVWNLTSIPIQGNKDGQIFFYFSNLKIY